VRLEELAKLKSSDLIGNRTHDLPACIIAPQLMRYCLKRGLLLCSRELLILWRFISEKGNLMQINVACMLRYFFGKGICSFRY
jgi:hypothetical protein